MIKKYCRIYLRVVIVIRSTPYMRSPLFSGVRVDRLIASAPHGTVSCYINARIVTQYQPIAPITMHPAARAISVTQLLVSTMPHWPLSPSYDINRLLCVRYVICYPTTLYLTPVSGHMTISPLALRVSTGVVPRSLCLSIRSSRCSWLPR